MRVHFAYSGRGDKSREKLLVFHFGLKAAGLVRMAEAALPLLPTYLRLTVPLPDETGEKEDEEAS